MITGVWRIGQIRDELTRVRLIAHVMVIGHERKEIYVRLASIDSPNKCIVHSIAGGG